MSNRKAVVEELEEISPLLANLKSDVQPPDPPEQYFVEMQSDVLWKIRQERGDVPAATSSAKTTENQVGWLRSFPWWVWRPAVAMAMIALGFWILQPLVKEKNSLEFSQLTPEETIDFMVANADNFNSEELITALPEESVWMEHDSGDDEVSREILLDAMLEALETEELETLY